MRSTLTLDQRLTLSLTYQRFVAVRARLEGFDAVERDRRLTHTERSTRQHLRDELARLTAELVTDTPRGGE